MKTIATHPIKITDTTLRDAHQSLWATRMRLEDMIPILPVIDQAGFHSVEVWGGATFDACLRYLDEDPWERLRILKQEMPKTPLQMLLRGQNVVGYRHYSDEIVKRFVHAAANNGIDIFRVFDALNDVRNLETSIKAVKETGKHAQGAVVYTVSPIHTLDHYLDTARALAELGVDSLCIKDMAALLTPTWAEKLVRALKSEFKLPVQIHCHYIGGMAPMNYRMAIEAGVDVIDTATTPLAFGNSQPATEMMVASLQETQYDPGLDLEKLYEIAEYFEVVRQRRGFKRGVTSLDHMKVFSHQVPGGMISNLFSQLEEQNALDRLPQVLEEIPRVRAEVGYPPLVTPTSQIVGTQAVLNVLSGKRWMVIPGEMKNYIRGYYGKPPGHISQDIADMVMNGDEPITVRPADLIDERWEKYAEQIDGIARCEEDILSYALFPNETKNYLEKHHDGAEKSVFMMGAEIHMVEEGEEEMELDKIKELIKLLNESDVNEITLEEGDKKVTLRKGAALPESSSAGEAAGSNAAETAGAANGKTGWKTITSPMVGTFYQAPAPEADAFVQVGDKITPGQTLCIIEAMKLMNEITAEEEGIIREKCTDNAHPVQYGETLFYYEPV